VNLVGAYLSSRFSCLEIILAPNCMATLDIELTRALSRLSGATSRLEASVTARRRNVAEGRDLRASRTDASALRDVHHAVTGKLDQTIERLRTLIGENGAGEVRRG